MIAWHGLATKANCGTFEFERILQVLFHTASVFDRFPFSEVEKLRESDRADPKPYKRSEEIAIEKAALMFLSIHLGPNFSSVMPSNLL